MKSNLDLITVELRLSGRLVDNASEISRLFAKSDHRVMPDTGVVLDRLFRCSQEDAQGVQIWPVICNYHKSAIKAK